MYCIYLRKSRADVEAEQRGEGETLSRHRDILTALAAHNHHVIGRIYQEIVSGETISDRPQIQQLISDLSEKKWEGVYVMEIERLARGDAMDQGLITHAFKASGALIITPLKTYNPASDLIDETFLEFSLFMSRQEFKTHYRRMQGGRVQSATEGKFLGSRAAYGYRKVRIPNNSGYTLAIHPEEAAVVRQVFDWYLNGIDGKTVGITVIGNRLSDLHVPVGEHGTNWDGCRIHRMLTNPVYIGLIQWGRDKTVRNVTPAGVTKKRVLRKQGDLHPGMHPAIISKEVFDAVQKKLHAVGTYRTVPVHTKRTLSNPLAQLLVCSECGHVMSHMSGSSIQAPIVKCITRGCPTVQNYRAPVEEAVLSTLRSWVSDIGREPSAPAPEQDDRAFITSAIASMQADRQKLLRQIDNLHDLVEQQVYSVQQFNERYTVLHQRLNELEASLAAEQSRLDAQPAYCTHEELQPAILRLLDLYDSSTPAEKNALLKECISKILYKKTTPGRTLHGKLFIPANTFELVVLPKLK